MSRWRPLRSVAEDPASAPSWKGAPELRPLNEIDLAPRGRRSGNRKRRDRAQRPR
jgi:hypothetical protein